MSSTTTQPAGAQIRGKTPRRREGVVKMRKQEPRVDNVEVRANVLLSSSYVERPELHIAIPLRIRFAARDVELRCIDVHADGLAARAYASGKLQVTSPTAAAHIEAPLRLAVQLEADPEQWGHRARIP